MISKDSATLLILTVDPIIVLVHLHCSGCFCSVMIEISSFEMQESKVLIKGWNAEG